MYRSSEEKEEKIYLTTFVLKVIFLGLRSQERTTSAAGFSKKLEHESPRNAAAEDALYGSYDDTVFVKAVKRSVNWQTHLGNFCAVWRCLLIRTRSG